LTRLKLSNRKAGATAAVGTVLTAAVLASMALVPVSVQAQVAASPAPPPPPTLTPAPPPLNTVPVPGPASIGDFIKDRDAAIRLGKALFWDNQVGSDGIVACATCHFHAGADSRLKNTLHPGHDGAFVPGTGPNYTLQLGDFPFHNLSDPNDRQSPVVWDKNDRVGSQGVFSTQFIDIIRGSANELGTPTMDMLFTLPEFGNPTHLLSVRRATGRNTPSVINAVFNFRNFWDTRAQNHFNGVNPFGDRDPNAKVLKIDNNGNVVLESISLEDSSLASQAVGPPGNPVEMSYDGRTFPKIGKKMLSLLPLAKQSVHPQDCALGIIARSRLNPAWKGLTKSYMTMVKDAFQPQWWNSPKIITFDSTGHAASITTQTGPLSSSQYTMMEANFSLFWGLAIQAYESTLVSDQTPYDRFAAGDDTALTDQQKLGLDLFMVKGKCINCHGNSEFTNANVQRTRDERLERMIMGDDMEAVYDNGIYNTGVRPETEDPGLGGKDPFGNPLSESRLAQIGTYIDGRPVEVFRPDVEPVLSEERVVAQGAFKTPTIRNVELTAPYFHNGGVATLLQVVEFYNRGGDFADENHDNLDVDITVLGLTDEEKLALVAFMKSLTDERVRWQRAPFDHPEFLLPIGEKGDNTGSWDDGTGRSQAADLMTDLPATGGLSGIRIDTGLLPGIDH
jgi:cytochrome c peroxidase